jgi:hypothetical protein
MRKPFFQGAARQRIERDTLLKARDHDVPQGAIEAVGHEAIHSQPP